MHNIIWGYFKTGYTDYTGINLGYNICEHAVVNAKKETPEYSDSNAEQNFAVNTVSICQLVHTPNHVYKCVAKKLKC